jgi:hypothetical protein
MHRAPLALLLTLLASSAEPAAAVSVPFAGTFKIGFSAGSSLPGGLSGPPINAFWDDASGTAEVQYQGAALASVLVPAGAFVINRGEIYGLEQVDVHVQSQAGGFSSLGSTPVANLPLTGMVQDRLNLFCDPLDPMCFGYVGGFVADVSKIGVPGPGFEGSSILQQIPGYMTVENYQWNSAPWTVTMAGNQLQAESLGPVTCTGIFGSCPGSLFGASFTIVLELDPGQTGFGVGSGGASLLGGSGNTGGLDMALDVISGSGLLTASFQQATLADIASGFGVALPFALPGSLTSLWEIAGGDQFQGTAELTFAYDPALLPVGFDETQLAIAHLENGSWELLTGSVDADANTLTVATDSFSPFSLVSVPEPGAGLLLVAGAIGAGLAARRRRS